MNTRLVNSAAGVILAALTQNRTAAGIALALDSAQMLMTPETAAELEQGRLRVDEAERAYTFDTAELKRRIAELEAERHSTNEALSEAAEALRADQVERLSFAERAKRESSPGRRQAWLMLARVEESERVADALLTPEAARSADKLTRLLAPTQALREDDDPGRCLEVHAFSPRDGWRMICSSCDHGKDAECHRVGAGDRAC